jgi:hypothetical protein
MALEEVEYEYVNGTYLAQDRVRWRAVVERGHGTGASLSIKADIFLIILAIVIISIWTLVCVIRYFYLKKSGIENYIMYYFYDYVPVSHRHCHTTSSLLKVIITCLLMIGLCCCVKVLLHLTNVHFTLNFRYSTPRWNQSTQWVVYRQII